MDPPPWSGLSTVDALAVLNELELASLAGVVASYLAPFIAGMAFYGFVLRRPAERLGVIAPVRLERRGTGWNGVRSRPWILLSVFVTR